MSVIGQGVGYSPAQPQSNKITQPDVDVDKEYKQKLYRQEL
jgi:hypothetical protein